MQQKEVILEGTIKAFNEKGLKFTMDDVAKILGMSKKTIYTVFRDKESMFLAMVDYMFDSIKESEQQIVEDDALSTEDQTDSRSDSGELPGCGFQTALSVKGQVSGDLQAGGKKTGDRLGDNDPASGAGNGGRRGPQGQHSDRKDDAGGHGRTVFPERYPDSEQAFLSGSAR
mgnify:CR=1 FL=1